MVIKPYIDNSFDSSPRASSNRALQPCTFLMLFSLHPHLRHVCSLQGSKGTMHELHCRSPSPATVRYIFSNTQCLSNVECLQQLPLVFCFPAFFWSRLVEDTSVFLPPVRCFPAFFGRWSLSPGSRRRPIDPLRSVATRPIVHVDPYSAGRIFFPASFSLTTCIHDSAKYPLPCAEYDCRRQQSLHDSSSTLNKNIGSLGRNATYNGLLYLGDTSTLRNVIDFRS